MQRKLLCPLSAVLGLCLMMAGSQWAAAVNVMNYGADGNDYFQFTTPPMALDKASGFTTLIAFAMHVNADGTLLLGGVVCNNGVYVGPTNWNPLITTLKTPPTTVNRYEVCIGGWTDASFDNIKSLVASQGTGPGSILYRNFQALKNAVPGIDAINDDEEQTYDLNSATKFANMLGSLGFKFTLVPYTAQSFWVNLRNSLTNCDCIYLQCYSGGAGNDPVQWNTAFGNGVVVIPGQESNGSTPAIFHNWYLQTGVQGGFYYPDVVFNSTYWSAAIIEANGTAPATPAGVVLTPGGGQLTLAWNVVPGAISYNVKRSTSSGGEVTIANVSANNGWPTSNQYINTGLAAGTTYYYKVSAVNTNGESADSAEVNARPQASTGFNFGFEMPSLGNGNYQYNPSGASWTFGGTAGLIANGSGFSNPNALEGIQAAFIQYHGVIAQTISGLIPGQAYTLTYFAAQRPGNSQTWNVQIDNTVIQTNSPGGTSYATYTATFTATAASHVLSFVGTDLGGYGDSVFIDGVRVTIQSSALQPVLNSGFESPSIGLGNYQYYPSGGAWAFNHLSGLVANSSGFGNASAPEGIQAAFVQGNGTISQTISGLAPGQVYTLTYSAAQRPGNSETWNVQIDNAVIQTNSPGGTSYASYAATFTATAAAHVLSFVGTDLAGNGDSVFLDNVQLTAINLMAPTFGVPNVLGGSLILTGYGGTPHSGYTWLVTTNLSAPVIWTTNGSGTLNDTGAFSNAVPIKLFQPNTFFRFRMP
ncbi:MAG: DUF642 domain-containing protein [Verrucomicrobiae bacterium]|nr:DUF642 domain-containing protein [Verrucomicrobiae bacterium]